MGMHSLLIPEGNAIAHLVAVNVNGDDCIMSESPKCSCGVRVGTTGTERASAKRGGPHSTIRTRAQNIHRMVRSNDGAREVLVNMKANTPQQRKGNALSVECRFCAPGFEQSGV